MRTILSTAILLLLCSSGMQAQKLDRFGKNFARNLSRAPWGRPVEEGPLKVVVRKARLGSNGMLNAARNAGELTPEEQNALTDVARITVKEKGWFVRSAVEPGEYRLGLAEEKGSVHWYLRDAAGKVLGKRAIIIYEPSRKLAAYEITSGNECHVLRLSCGGIRFKFRFVSESVHDAVTRELALTKSERICLYTDLRDDDFVKTLLKDLEAGINSQQKLYGGEKPQGIFHLYLFRNQDDYLRMDKLMTDGEFAATGGFASRLTNRAYFNFRLEPEPLRDGATGYPVIARAAIVHELNHLVAEELMPGAVGYWTNWFAEGLAELGVELALEAQKKGEGQRYFASQVGAVQYHLERQTLPTVTDWSGGKMETNREAFYALSYLVCRRIYQDAPLLRELLAVNDTVRATMSSERLLRRGLEQKYGSIGALFKLVTDEVLAEKIQPARVHGFLDIDKDLYRITALWGNDARVIWPVKHNTSKGFRISVDFSFLNCRNNQVDVYFGYHEGRHTRQFMKVAILPRYIELWRQTHGKWQKLDGKLYRESLDLGEAGDLSWHKAVLRYEPDKKKLRVEVGVARSIEFRLKDEPLLIGGRIGLGTWGGAAWFKSPKLREFNK